MLKRNFFYLFIPFLAFLTACEKEVEPSAGNGILQINEIELVGVSSAGSARSSAQNIWKHSYQNPLTLNFKSDQTGKNYSIELNPNDLSSNNFIELPLGTYMLTSDPSNEVASNSLPLDINQPLNLTTAKQIVTLKATSHYGLFTITDKNLSNAPKALSPISYVLIQKENFYYAYFIQNQKLTFEIATKPEQSFRQTWNSKAFEHRHLSLDNSEIEDDVENFTKSDFSISESIIPLDNDGVPTALAPTEIAELPNSQSEISGLAIVNGRLFSHNDGGNSNELFELNATTGEVIRTIKVSNATNVDWEDLAVSASELYIGDFGNNSGTRKDLAIYKLKLDELLNSNEVTAEKISYTLSDQTDFQSSPNATNYDCEAMIFWEGQLYLFSKNWKDTKTNVYSLSAEKGNRIAELKGNFDTQGLITGACTNQKGNLVLLGYENKGISSRSLVWVASKFAGDDFFSGNTHKIYLGSPAILSQTEGVAFIKDETILISGEAIKLGGSSVPARLNEIDLTGIF